MLEKCQNYKFFDIFWDIINKMKDNLEQEWVSILPGENWKILLQFPWKNDSFHFTLIFRLSLPKIWLSRPDKNYIFEMSNNRSIPWKGFIMLSFRL